MAGHHTPHTRDVVERFWTKVVKNGQDECWFWSAGKSRGRYGQFWMEGRVEGAHRVAWAIKNGVVPDGMHVLHRCDNPTCVNPSHLWLGTHADNMADREAKGRGHQPKGARNGSARLTREIVRQIRHVYANGTKTQARLAEIFGVNNTCISKIVRREKWASVQ